MGPSRLLTGYTHFSDDLLVFVREVLNCGEKPLPPPGGRATPQRRSARPSSETGQEVEDEAGAPTQSPAVSTPPSSAPSGAVVTSKECKNEIIAPQGTELEYSPAAALLGTQSASAFSGAAWLREVISLSEARELRRRTAWLMQRLPQLEQESSNTLVSQHLTLVPLPTDALGINRLSTPEAPIFETQHNALALTPLGENSTRLDPDALTVPSLKIKRHGGIVQITISRASHANAYNSEMLNALERLIPMLTAQVQEEASHPPRTPAATLTHSLTPPLPSQQRTLAVIFHSDDKRFFCAGADLERVSNPRAEDALNLQSQRVFELISKAPWVSIAVVEGAAVAGGFEWALACDARIVGKAARFWLPETALGLIPAAGGCTRLTELVGASRAKRVVLFHERIDANRALEWGVAQSISENPLQRRSNWPKFGTDQSLARSLAKSLIDSHGGGGGGHEESLKSERIAEGLLYEAKYKPRAVICGLGTAAPEERYTQKEVADLLQVDDPRMRAIYSAAHIESRRLAEIGSEQTRGTTQGHLLDKHLRWAKKLGAVAIPAACAASGIEVQDVCFIVVCTTTGFLSPGLSAHIANHVRLPSTIQRVDIVGMGCHAGLNAMATAAHWAEANPGKPALMFACEVVSAGYMWDSSKPGKGGTHRQAEQSKQARAHRQAGSQHKHAHTAKQAQARAPQPMQAQASASKHPMCSEFHLPSPPLHPTCTDIAIALTNSLFGDGSAAAILMCPTPIVPSPPHLRYYALW